MIISAIKYYLLTYFCTQHSCYQNKSLVERKRKSITVYERVMRESNGGIWSKYITQGLQGLLCSSEALLLFQRIKAGFPTFMQQTTTISNSRSRGSGAPFLPQWTLGTCWQTTCTNKIINTLHTYNVLLNLCIKLILIKIKKKMQVFRIISWLYMNYISIKTPIYREPVQFTQEEAKVLLVGQIMLHVSVRKLFLKIAAMTTGLPVLAIAFPACNGKVVKETI